MRKLNLAEGASFQAAPPRGPAPARPRREGRRVVLLLILLLPAEALAQAKEDAAPAGATRKLEADASRNYLRLAYNFYAQTEGGGNPELNENMQVHEPQALLGLGLTQKLTLSLKMQTGVVSAASTNGGAPGRTVPKKSSAQRRQESLLLGSGRTSGPKASQFRAEEGDEDGEDGPVSGASGGGGGGPVSGASGGNGGGPVSGASAAGGDGGTVSGASAGGGEGGEKGKSLSSGEPFVSVEPGLFYAWCDEVGTGVGMSYTQERSYRSIGGNARVVLSTPDKNDTFLIRGSAAFDTLRIRYFDGTGSGSDSRTTLGVGLGWTHILTPRTQATLNYDLTWQRGQLATTYNAVFVAGTEVREILPDTRLRHAFFGRARHLLLDDLAVEPGAGFYVDDWGSMASSLEVRGSWEFVPGVLILQPAYRFHWQRQVKFFTDKSEGSVPAFRTQDSDLGSFTSHTIGLKLVAPKVNIFGVDTEFELGGDYTFRSDHLNSFSATAGFLVRF